VFAEVFGTRVAAHQRRAVQDVRRDGKRGRAKQVPAEVHRNPAGKKPTVQQGNLSQR